jgi:hypothetical protein
MITDVSLRPLYLILIGLLGWPALLNRTSSSKDIELLVQRHEVANESATPAPRFVTRRRCDRRTVAGVTRR